MHTIRVIHWKPAEAEPRVRRLKELGYKVAYEELQPESYRHIRDEHPDILLIDLSRLPSHGREMALFFRQKKCSRQIPIVFAGGADEKVERVRQAVPDAIYTSWSRIKSELSRAIKNPPKVQTFPQSSLSGYSGTPLIKKLGIRSDSVLALVNAPKDFERTLGELPNNVGLRHSARGNRDLTIWFVDSMAQLASRIDAMAHAVKDGDGLWIAWPKKASGRQTDVTQNDVRKIGLATGLVDYKICAIDETWSGLKFARRK